MCDLSISEILDGDDITIGAGPISPASQTIANTPKPSTHIAYKKLPVEQVETSPVDAVAVEDNTLATSTTTASPVASNTQEDLKTGFVSQSPSYSQAKLQSANPTGPADSSPEVRKLLTQKHPSAQQSLLLPVASTSGTSAATRGRSLLKTQRSKEKKCKLIKLTSM